MIRIIYNQTESDGKLLAEKAADEETVYGAAKIYKTLKKEGHQAQLEVIDKDMVVKQNNLFDQEDKIVNYCEWTGKNVEYEYNLLKILEDNKCRYTGCNLKEHQELMDKSVMKKVIKNLGYPVLNSVIFTDGNIKGEIERLNFPVIIKTTLEHCSIGIEEDSLAISAESAVRKAGEVFRKYQQPVMIEEFAEGNEYQVFVFATSHGVKTLPVYETVYRKLKMPVFLTCDDNWLSDSVKSKVRKIGITSDRKKDKLIRKMAKELFIKLGGVGYIRIDLREKDGKLFILEVNPNPSIAWTEDLDFIKVCAEGAKMTYPDILHWVLSGAL